LYLAGVASSLTIIFLALFAFPWACQHVRQMRANRQNWAGARICYYGNTERRLSVSRTDGTEAPDRFRFSKNRDRYFPGSSNRSFRRGQPRPTAARNTHKRYAVSAKSLVGFCGNFPVMDSDVGLCRAIQALAHWSVRDQPGSTGTLPPCASYSTSLYGSATSKTIR